MPTIRRLLADLGRPLRISREPSVRTNPLLAGPPRAYHGADPGTVMDLDLGIQGLQRFRAAMGRDPTPEDYRGVHTTGSLALAAFYALSTAEHTGSGFRAGDPWPVVLVLDVTGLAELPDVDALMQASDIFSRSTCLDIIQSPNLQYAMDLYGEQRVDETSDAWERLGHVESNPVRAVLDAVDEDERRAMDILRRCAETGRIDPRVASFTVDQRRWIMDFDADRLVEVLAVKPVWRKVLGDDWTDLERDEAGDLEGRGWQVVTDDELPGSIDPVTMSVWRNPGLPARRNRRTQYHGTSSSLARKAFPSVPWPRRAPYPVTAG